VKCFSKHKCNASYVFCTSLRISDVTIYHINPLNGMKHAQCWLSCDTILEYRQNSTASAGDISFQFACCKANISRSLSLVANCTCSNKTYINVINPLPPNEIYVCVCVRVCVCVCVSYRTANLQTLRFKYLFIKYPY
jgi:hypothetical protein